MLGKQRVSCSHSTVKIFLFLLSKFLASKFTNFFYNLGGFSWVRYHIAAALFDFIHC